MEEQKDKRIVMTDHQITNLTNDIIENLNSTLDLEYDKKIAWEITYNILHEKFSK